MYVEKILRAPHALACPPFFTVRCLARNSTFFHGNPDHLYPEGVNRVVRKYIRPCSTRRETHRYEHPLFVIGDRIPFVNTFIDLIAILYSSFETHRTARCLPCPVQRSTRGLAPTTSDTLYSCKRTSYNAVCRPPIPGGSPGQSETSGFLTPPRLLGWPSRKGSSPNDTNPR